MSPATRVDAIHAALAAKELLPAEHSADGAYLSAALLVRSRREHGVTLRGPVRLRPPSQTTPLD